MNRIIATLVASLVVSTAAIAQTAAPAAAPAATPAATKAAENKAKQEAVQSTTQSAVGTSGATATAKQQAEDHRRVEEGRASRRRNSAPPTPRLSAVYSQSGTSTAAQAQKNTAVSKEMPKQTVNMGTPAAEKAMEKAAKP